MTDTEELKSLIRDSGIKYVSIAKKLGITYYSLQKKIKNEREFKASEIAKLCDILRIENSTQKDQIFFKKKVI